MQAGADCRRVNLYEIVFALCGWLLIHSLLHREYHDFLTHPKSISPTHLDAVDGDGLLTPPPFLLFMLLMVVEMVCLAACFARSVDTKLLTRSFRFPFISGEDSSRSKPPPPLPPAPPPSDGEEGEDEAAAGAGEPLLADLTRAAEGSVADLTGS